nr:response regulator [Lactiplantibacillus plantarum]
MTRRIRQDSKTPIIMLTAKSSDESIVNGLQSGADDYVVKPFSPRVVVERIKRTTTCHRRTSGKSSLL